MKNIAVIGFGNIAARHRRNIRLIFPDAKIYGMSASGRMVADSIIDCDEVVTDINMLANIAEMAIIASPATFHRQHALPFIKANVPVLIEKPVIASLDDAQELQLACENFKATVAVGYCLRYLPSALMLKKVLQEHLIGKLLNARISVGQYLPDWRTTKNYKESVSARSSLGGGALLELSHEIDYARWLLGELTIQHAIIRNSGTLDIDVEDVVDIVAANKNNTVAHIHLDFLQRQAFRKCEFIGIEGRLEWDLIENKLSLHASAGTKVLYHDDQYNKNKMYLDMLQDFILRISGKPNECISLEDAISTITTIDQIKKVAN